MYLVFGLALALGAGALQPHADEHADAVTLDVVVEDSRGLPVDSLTSADFAVTERGVPLTVASAHFIRANGSSSSIGVPAPAASSLDERWQVTADTRLIGIFLDEFHVAPGESADLAREALERFVREDLGPRDLVAVLKPLDSLLTIRLTRDREAVAREIEDFSARRGDYAPRSFFERNFIAGSADGIDAARAQIAASSLNALVRYLGQFSPSRKTVIVLSEVLAQRGSSRASAWLPGFETIVRAANRGHVSIYPIDPLNVGRVDPQDNQSAAHASDETKMREALRALATETNGRAILSVNNVERDLRRTLADASGFYVLTVSRSDADEAFHPVDVSVQRPGLALLARKGYWAPVDDRETPLAKTASARLSASIARRSSPLIRPWFGMAPGTDGATRISFVWEPAPRVPGERGGPAPPAQVDLLVTTLDGATVFDGVVLPAGGGAPSPSASASSRASFEIPAGPLLVQMAIQDSTSRVVDRDVRDLSVPTFPGPVSLGSAEFLRARNAREFQALMTDPDSVPVAAREFSRAERLLVRVPVLSDNRSPVVSARLVTRFGAEMRQLAASLSARADVYQVDLPLAGLPAGAYILELTAKTADGQVSDSHPFRITP